MKIVILNECFFNKDHLARLKKIGELKIYNDTTTEEQVMERLKDADIAIVDQFIAPVNKKVIGNANNLKLIALNTTSFSAVDFNAANKRKIKVANVPGFSKQAVAELAIGLMFAVNRKIALGDRLLRETQLELDPGNKEHQKFIGVDLKGKTLGVIGLGRIGTIIAQLGMGLGMNVIAYNRSPKNMKGVKMLDMKELLKTSDVVIISVPLTNDTRNFISKKELNLMKNTAILINIAPHEVIDKEALYEALKSNRISGAGIDDAGAFKSNKEFFKLENVVLTPHCGSFTKESFFVNLPEIIVKNVESFARGKPVNIVNS